MLLRDIFCFSRVQDLRDLPSAFGLFKCLLPVGSRLLLRSAKDKHCVICLLLSLVQKLKIWWGGFLFVHLQCRLGMKNC